MPKEERHQILESILNRERDKGEIMGSKEESSSSSMSLIFLWRWRFQVEERKKLETGPDLLREGAKI